MQRSHSEVTYTPLSAGRENEPADDSESEKANSDGTLDTMERSSRGRFGLWAAVGCLILLFSLCSAVAAWTAGYASGKSAIKPQKCYVDDEQCTTHLSTISPAIEANVIEYYSELWPAPDYAEHTFSGPPTYERELAWTGQENGRIINVPKEHLEALGKTDDMSRLMTPDGGYAATLMIHHQLQCLGALRRWTYKDEYLATMVEVPELFRASKENVHSQLDYCIDLLRRSLLCTSDVTPVLLGLNESAPLGYRMDLRTTHKKCRKFDKIRDWEEDNRAMDTNVTYIDAFAL